MIIYLIKIILCAALFISVYKGILENEKMHRFNRFYLLGSLVFSILVPFLTFSQEIQHLHIAGNIITETEFVADDAGAQLTIMDKNTPYQPLIFLTIYVSIATLLFFRFAVNLTMLLQRTWTNSIIQYKNFRIVLIDRNITPHSFLGYIFVNTEDYSNGNIEKEILLHELAHVKQKHSLDILFFEIVQVFFWFNPILFIYRKAITLNHEFLADEAVINSFNNVSEYQRLLLEKVSQQGSSYIISQFNYSITKKRLLMMTKTKSFGIGLCKQLAVLPILGISLLLFSTNIEAQETSTIEKPNQTEVQSTKDGITEKQLSEFVDIVNGITNDKGRPEIYKLTEAERKKLEDLYMLMSKEQQKSQLIIVTPSPPPLPKSTPTQDQIESWKDAKMYGVWIDGTRISNTELNNYSRTDFSQVFVSRLEKNAINYGKHYYQVNLMTPDYYADYYKKTTDRKFLMGYRGSSKK